MHVELICLGLASLKSRNIMAFMREIIFLFLNNLLKHISHVFSAHKHTHTYPWWTLYVLVSQHVSTLSVTLLCLSEKPYPLCFLLHEAANHSLSLPTRTAALLCFRKRHPFCFVFCLSRHSFQNVFPFTCHVNKGVTGLHLSSDCMPLSVCLQQLKKDSNHF